jgi:hypothetical protein
MILEARVSLLETQNRSLIEELKGEFHDQADANWIVIRGLLRGYNVCPAGSQLPGLVNLKAYLVFSVPINIVRLTVELTESLEVPLLQASGDAGRAAALRTLLVNHNVESRSGP